MCIIWCILIVCIPEVRQTSMRVNNAPSVVMSDVAFDDDAADGVALAPPTDT